jgi:hypothetical protein
MEYVTSKNYRSSHSERRVLSRTDFLSRFQLKSKGQVNSQGVENFLALCPAHEDKNPSLLVGITREGRYLVHCYSGCSGADVVASVGLTLADLYPDGAIDPAAPSHRHSFRDAILDEVGKRPLSDDEKRAAFDAFKRSRKDREWPQRD